MDRSFFRSPRSPDPVPVILASESHSFLQSSKRYLQAAPLMLDVQFGQVSDFGKVRKNN